MPAQLTLAVDLMGGDLGPRSTLPAALNFAQANPELAIILVGEASTAPSSLPDNVHFVVSTQVVSMSDKPAYALRNKQDSSMWKAIDLVARGEAQACISAGNTGALMAMGKYLLKTFPGIDRPAICKAVPTAKGASYVLDLGANVDCTSEQLVQFALMGSVLAETAGVSSPSVGLLNIGSEDIKGNEQIRLASALLESNDHLNYVGYIEGDGIFTGAADVVVCDGFVGNVALKVSEGVARLLASYLRELLEGGFWNRLVGQIARPLLLKWHTKFDPARYNGASFLGLQGVVVKSHGSVDAKGFECALAVAKEQAAGDIPNKINHQIADCLH
ncbi:phosphate acyltransferase PlsX [Aestuariicella hydrocarbonica]|uniref:Phosphate acyltransferase n=1 Tax=Pseudomaricurvus hydrocarbonicus TaxID=1470433 RepID=A0A9E5JTJ5_9GAMM|nr:phosphate acyltransferase PlsX [Aestuariicella hydrocarbonica]NHO65236.1 phosphate acyltransferase PlsX [Aestuariicella hydrocarbonica]